jgi:nucleotide-binding universal stress UspA family protein
VFRNILVCVDDSPQAGEALAQAIDLADCQHSRLTILTAITQPPTWLATPMTAPRPSRSSPRLSIASPAAYR